MANDHIVDSVELRRLSGLQQPAAVKRWATTRGIRVCDGADGPWTTIEAINKALGVSSASNDHTYSPDIV